MTRRPPILWLRIATEGAVIVLSILLAFWIDAAWDERQERTEEVEVLRGLEAEFADLVSRLQRTASRYDTLTADLRWLLSEAAADSPIADLDRTLQAALWAGTFDPGQGVRDALVSSGRLEIVQNEELRLRLSGWAAVLDETRDNEIGMRDFVFQRVVPHLAATGIQTGRVLPRVRQAIDIASDPDDYVAYARLLADREFRSLAQYRYNWLALSHSEFSDTAARAGEILALVRSELRQ